MEKNISTQFSFPLSCPYWYAQDLKHVFDKVDRNKDEYVNRMVGEKKNNSTTAGLAKVDRWESMVLTGKLLMPPFTPVSLSSKGT